MEDMDSKLNAMLNDPAAMARIIQMAQQLSGGAAQASPPPPPPPHGAPPPPADGGFDPMLLARFLPLLQDLRQSNSQTTQLLYALRPFLKEEKQPKVERAAKLAHLICIGKRFLTEGGLDIVGPLRPRGSRQLCPGLHGRRPSAASAPQAIRTGRDASAAAAKATASPAAQTGPATGDQLWQGHSGRAASGRSGYRRSAAVVSAVLPVQAEG